MFYGGTWHRGQVPTGGHDFYALDENHSLTDFTMTLMSDSQGFFLSRTYVWSLRHQNCLDFVKFEIKSGHSDN